MRFRSSAALTERLRAGVRIAALISAILLCYPLHVAHRVLSTGPSPWVQRFLWLAGRAAGLKVHEDGQALPAPVLFVANHVSWLDILLLGGARGSAFVSKAEVSRWPLLGGLARLGGTVFVERTDRTAAGGQAALLAEALLAGRPVTLFAEGTTGDGYALQRLRPSLFAAVAGSIVPVQPVAIRYDAPSTVFWPPDEPAGRNALRLLGRRGRVGVTLAYLQSIDASALDRKAIAAESHARIAAALIR